MKRSNNLYKKVGKVLTVISFILSGCYTLLTYLKVSTYTPVLFTAFLFVLLFIITYIKDGYVIEKIFQLINSFNKHPFNGTWIIEITYENENKEKCNRTGSCEFIDTIFGISIKGGNIKDSQTNKLEVESWIAANVDVHSITENNKEVHYLIYHYNTYSDKERNNITKTGFVVAKGLDGLYEGTFEDFIVSEGKMERKGTVKLFKAKTSRQHAV